MQSGHSWEKPWALSQGACWVPQRGRVAALTPGPQLCEHHECWVPRMKGSFRYVPSLGCTQWVLFPFLELGQTSKGPQPPDKSQCPCPFPLRLAFLLHRGWRCPSPCHLEGALRRERGQGRAEGWTAVVIQSWFAMTEKTGQSQLERAKGLLWSMDFQRVWSLVSHGGKEQKGR